MAAVPAVAWAVPYLEINSITVGPAGVTTPVTLSVTNTGTVAVEPDWHFEIYGWPFVTTERIYTMDAGETRDIVFETQGDCEILDPSGEDYGCAAFTTWNTMYSDLPGGWLYMQDSASAWVSWWRPSPSFGVTLLSVPATIEAETPFAIQVRIENNGFAPANIAFLHVALDNPPPYNRPMTLLSTATPGLAVGASMVRTVTITVPATFVGNQRLGVEVSPSALYTPGRGDCGDHDCSDNRSYAPPRWVSAPPGVDAGTFDGGQDGGDADALADGGPDAVSAPDADVPDASSAGRPDADLPDVAAAHVDAAAPDAMAPDATAPDAAVPDANAPDATEDAASTPDAVTEDATTPDTTVDAASPDDATAPDVSLPDVVSADAAAAVDADDRQDASAEDAPPASPDAARPTPSADVGPRDAERHDGATSEEGGALGCTSVSGPRGTPDVALVLMLSLAVALARRRTRPLGGRLRGPGGPARLRDPLA